MFFHAANKHLCVAEKGVITLQDDVQSFPLSAKQTAQIPSLGESLSHCQ